jgi:hypothetical protein
MKYMSDTQEYIPDLITMSIRDFITDPRVEKYLDRVLGILKNIENEFNRTDIPRSYVGFEISFKIFGGFVRDIVAGIPYNNLVEKDVDVYIDFKFLDKRYYLNTFGFMHLISKMKSTLKRVYGVKVLNRLTDIGNFPKIPESFANYDVIKTVIDGIKIDMACDLSNEPRFEGVLDFTCNSLYFPISTEELKVRTKFCTIEEVMEHISKRKLVSFIGKEPYFTKQDSDHRTMKMLQNGYCVCAES